MEPADDVGLPLVTFAAPDAGWNLPATGWHAGREPGRVARYLEEGSTIDGRRFRVQELTGSPGDVILMHPRTLHAPAPNSRPGPRMMLVEIIGRLAGVR